MATTKYCFRCKTDLPYSSFGNNTARKDGLSAYCKECRKVYGKKWKSQNPQSVKRSTEKSKIRVSVSGYAQEYYRLNRERIKARSLAYHSSHREEDRQKCRERYRADPELYYRRSREWQAKNPESVNASKRRYVENNIDKILSHYGYLV